MQSAFRSDFGDRPDEEVTIPHEVIVLEEELGCSLVRAWREHMGLTQAVVAKRMGVSRTADAQMEAKGSRCGWPPQANRRSHGDRMGTVAGV